MANTRPGPLAKSGEIDAAKEQPHTYRKLRAIRANAIARRYVAGMSELPANTFVRARSYLKVYKAHVFVAKYRDTASRNEVTLMTFWVKDDRQVVLIDYLNAPKQPAPKHATIFHPDTVQPMM